MLVWAIAASLALGASGHQMADITAVSIGATAQTYDRLTITLTFEAEAGETLSLTWPAQWGPEENLGQLRSKVRLTGPGSHPVGYVDQGGRLRVTGLQPGPYTVRYDVTQDYEGLPQWGDHRVPGMRPVLQPDFATAIARTILPQLSDEDATITLTLLDTQAAANRPIGPDGTTRMLYRTLADGVFVFGAFRYGETDQSGIAIRQAVRGDWALDDAAIADSAQAVLGVGSRLFEDPVFDQYFIALTPLPDIPGNSAVIGSGFNEAFFILATQNAEAANLSHTIVHEVLHEWIPRRAGRTDEATDPSRAWFTEGFTEYFTQRILLETGLITLDDFVANYDAMLQAYLSSSVNTMPAGALNERLFDSRETERLPYQRGALLALSWDTALKADGALGLAQVITDLIDRADALTASGETAILTDAAIHAALAERLGDRFTEDFQTHIRRGERIDPATLTLPACMRVEARMQTVHFAKTGTASQPCISAITRR